MIAVDLSKESNAEANSIKRIDFGRLTEAVKSQASGRWAHVLATVGGVPEQHFDGCHHACPKCGGTDRWRFVDADQGGGLCNKCLPTGGGDGIALAAWLTGRDVRQPEQFKGVVLDLAKLLGVDTEGFQKAKGAKNSKRPAGGQEGGPAAKKPAKQKPVREFTDDDFWAVCDPVAAADIALAQFCETKPPLVPDTLEAMGARAVRWPKKSSQVCIAVPAFVRNTRVGWLLRRRDGQTFSAFGNLPERKTHLLKGSSDGLISATSPSRLSSQDFSTVWFVEGSLDAAALDPWLHLDHVAVSGACRAGSIPPGLSDVVRGKSVVVIFDCDEPGVNGSKRVAEEISAAAAEIKIVELPYATTKSHGKDLRDFANDQGQTWLDRLLEIVEAAPLFVPQQTGEEAESGQGNGADEANTARELIPNEAVDDPHRLAREFLNGCTTSDGIRTLVFYQGEFFRWKGTRYDVIDEVGMRAELTTSIKSEFDRWNLLELESSFEESPTVQKVTGRVVSDVRNAVTSMCLLSRDIIAPAWLNNSQNRPPADRMFAMGNGLLRLPNGLDDVIRLDSHTPEFFSRNSVDYGYDPAAICPHWFGFLDSVWPGDHESVGLLQRWLGYILTGSNRFHKLLMVIGPARSGKGTIGRLISALIGERNVASPKLSSLASPYGLWPLLGKSVAIIGDARLSGRVDSVSVVENLLSITGGDHQEVNRKFLSPLTGIELPVRFVVLSNELPRLADNSAAIMSRVLLLQMTRSFLGAEDRSLDEKLRSERPGILNWALEGLRMLNEEGQFQQPKSAQEMLDDLQDLSSPITAFLEERCDLNPETFIFKEDLFRAWKQWCEEHNRGEAGSLETFGRNLLAAVPTVKTTRPRGGESRKRGYCGIRLR